MLIRPVVYGILVLYVQILFMPAFEIWGAVPNLLIIYNLMVGKHLDLSYSIPILFLVGLGVDTFYPELFGLNSFIMILLALIVNRFHVNINEDQFSSVAGSILLLNIAYYFFYFLYQILHNVDVIMFSAFSLVVILYNALFTIFAYYLVQFVKKIRIVLDV